MSENIRKTLLEALTKLSNPETGNSIVSDNMVSDINLENGKAIFSLAINPAYQKQMEEVRSQAQKIAESIEGINSALVILTASKSNPPKKKKSNIQNIIAVASGKGGVGKSTVAANLAMAYANMGKKVGLMDADIYGASQPRMMGVTGQPETDAKTQTIIPPEAHGIKVISMGFFMDDNSPVVWRGPMVHKAIDQMLNDVVWGDLDVLVVDLPPGTGDVQISLSKVAKISGAVIVSTPQEIALSEAKKGLLMFRKVHVPVIGMIENMSYHVCSSCGSREDIFTHGKTQKVAKALGVEFLGEIPLHNDICASSDSGTPFVKAQKEHAIAETYKNIASRIWIGLPSEQAPAPYKKTAK